MISKKLYEKRSLLFVSLILLTIICFYNAIFMEFVWDDYSHYAEFTKRLKSFTSLFTFFKSTNIVGEPFYYRPLMLLSYGIDFLIYKQNPAGYHITSILLHIANVLLVFLITEKLLNKKIAYVSALLFAIHPIHCEPVVWISARADVLSAFFAFLSLYYYIHFNEKHKLGLFLLTTIFFAFSIFTKEVTIMLLPTFIIFPYFTDKKLTKETTYLFIILSFVTICYFFIRLQIVGKFIFDYYPLETKIATAPIVLISYLKLFFYPFDLHLLYKSPSVLEEATLESILALLILILIGVLTFFIYKRKRIISFFVVFYFLFLLPISGIITFVRTSIIADRYLYLPSYGLIVICAYYLIKIYDFLGTRYLKECLKAIFFAVILILCISSIKRNKAWEKNFTTLQIMIKDVPTFHVGYLQLGLIYLQQRQYKEAEKAFTLALKFAGNEDKPRALNNLCGLYLEQQKYDLAEKYCLEGIRMYKGHSKLYFNLANIYIGLKRFEDAYNTILAAIQYENDNPKIYNLASYIAINLGILDDALFFVNKAIELDSANEGYRSNREIILKKLYGTN